VGACYCTDAQLWIERELLLANPENEASDWNDIGPDREDDDLAELRDDNVDAEDVQDWSLSFPPKKDELGTNLAATSTCQFRASAIWQWSTPNSLF
jgi:hypothetical protein